MPDVGTQRSSLPLGVVLTGESSGLHVHSSTVFPAGSRIYGPGEASDTLYLVESGGVRICRFLADGRRLITAFYLRSETFGLERDDKHHSYAEAFCPTTLKSVRGTMLHHENASELFPVAVSCFAQAEEHSMLLGRQSCIERVAIFLLEMTKRQSRSSHIALPMTRIDIADYLCLTPETLSRVLSRLRTDGVIAFSGLREIHILKWQTLNKLAS